MTYRDELGAAIARRDAILADIRQLKAERADAVALRAQILRDRARNDELENQIAVLRAQADRRYAVATRLLLTFMIVLTASLLIVMRF